jgi:hypothetical protein
VKLGIPRDCDHLVIDIATPAAAAVILGAAES